jgi:hypothetical protein
MTLAQTAGAAPIALAYLAQPAPDCPSFPSDAQCLLRAETLSYPDSTPFYNTHLIRYKRVPEITKPCKLHFERFLYIEDYSKAAFGLALAAIILELLFLALQGASICMNCLGFDRITLLLACVVNVILMLNYRWAWASCWALASSCGVTDLDQRTILAEEAKAKLVELCISAICLGILLTVGLAYLVATCFWGEAHVQNEESVVDESVSMVDETLSVDKGPVVVLQNKKITRMMSNSFMQLLRSSDFPGPHPLQMHTQTLNSRQEINLSQRLELKYGQEPEDDDSEMN